jgi:adenine-specific DNA-methyltransferase
MARDTVDGELRWSGHHLVDPWDGDTGALVSLGDYPKLKAYLEENAEALQKRNVAGRRPQQWYRTIDRVAHSLTGKPKLLLPDIKAAIHPVLDPGGLYPHHNLYWVASELWDPQVLGGLLLSSVAQMFVECYAVKMRGGYLRFQAQYLRRIRVPRRDLVPRRTARELAHAFEARDVERATAAALDAYGLEELPV